MNEATEGAASNRCNCKKSGCLKLYCECFASKTKCSELCQCVGCQNTAAHEPALAQAYQNVEKRQQKLTPASANSTSTAAATIASFRSPPPTASSTSSATRLKPKTKNGGSSTGSAASNASGSARLLLIRPPVGAKMPLKKANSRGRCDCEDGKCQPESCVCLQQTSSCQAECSCHGCRLDPAATTSSATLVKTPIAAIRKQLATTKTPPPPALSLPLPPPQPPPPPASVIKMPIVSASVLPSSEQRATRGCSCKKSNCLKLYCECLASQRFCDARCHCAGCKNRPEHEETRDKAIASILERNPLAFQPKVSNGTSQRHLRGCNCRKTNCLKNYCECFQAGVACSSRCACHQCHNTENYLAAKKMLAFSSTPDSLRTPRRSRQPDELRGVATAPPVGYDTTAFGSHAAHASMTPAAIAAVAAAPATTAGFRVKSPMIDASPSSFVWNPANAAPTSIGKKSPARRSLKRRFDQVKQSLQRTSGAMEVGSSGSSDQAFGSKDQDPNERMRKPSHTPVLESVEGCLERLFEAPKAAAQLKKMCRSLLHAAIKADQPLDLHREEDKKPAGSSTRSSQHSTVDNKKDNKKIKRRRDDSSSSETETVDSEASGASRGGVSPSTEELLCEEDIDLKTGSNDKSEETVPSDAQAATFKDHTEVDGTSPTALEQRHAMQERAVLQEFSVWLHKLASPTSK